MPEMMQTAVQPSARYQKLLSQEVDACEDPVCCCEAEPRWRRIEHENTCQPGPSEWEALERSPSDEL